MLNRDWEEGATVFSRKSDQTGPHLSCNVRLRFARSAPDPDDIPVHETDLINSNTLLHFLLPLTY